MTFGTKVTVPHISDGSAQRSDGQHAPSVTRPSSPGPNQISFAPFTQQTFRPTLRPFRTILRGQGLVAVPVSSSVRRLDHRDGLRKAIQRLLSVGYERLMTKSECARKSWFTGPGPGPVRPGGGRRAGRPGR